MKAHAFQLTALSGIVDPLRALPNLHLVLLSRRDLVGQAISWSRAQQTGQHRANDLSQGEYRYDQAHIREALHFLLRQRRRWSKLLRMIGAEPLVIEYEDLLCDPQRAAGRVAALMKLDDVPQIDRDLVSVSIQRDALSEEWRLRFFDDTGDEFRHLADPPRLPSTPGSASAS